MYENIKDEAEPARDYTHSVLMARSAEIQKQWRGQKRRKEPHVAMCDPARTKGGQR